MAEPGAISQVTSKENDHRTPYLPSYDAGPQGMLIPPILQLYILQRQQWLDLESLARIQRKKLAALVNDAYDNVRYYRRLFDSAKIKPSDIKSAYDLRKVPITERRDLQTRSIGDVTAGHVDLRKCKKTLTAGSSARPLMSYRTTREDNLIDIVWARGCREDGQRIWDKNADYHSYLYIPRRWFEHLGIWRRTTIPTFAPIYRQVEVVKRARPDIIRGNSFELATLARAVQRDGIEEIRPRLVFQMGQFLDEQTRKLIESALHTKVFDFYASTELGCLAWECSEHFGYHINMDSVVLEVLDNNDEPVSPGERGKLICTGLLSHAMPFIRYNMGDVGSLSDESCPCGRGLPILEHLDGRAYDFFISADGASHSPSLIQNQILRVPGVQQFKVVQESETSVTVNIVPDTHFSIDTTERLKEIMKGILGNNTDVRVEIVGEIPRDPSGKLQAIVSKVRRNQ